MIATCRFSRSTELADHQRGRFVEFDQEYPITPGRDYVIAGIGIWELILHVLIRDDDGLPSWCPAGLFDIDLQRIPDGWVFALCDGVSASGTQLWTRWVARWGYDDLVRDPAHSDLLMERDPTAIAVFEEELQRREGPIG